MSWDCHIYLPAYLPEFLAIFIYVFRPDRILLRPLSFFRRDQSIYVCMLAIHLRSYPRLFRLSIYYSLYISVSVFLYICLSISVSRCLFISIFISISFRIYVHIDLSISISIVSYLFSERTQFSYFKFQN